MAYTYVSSVQVVGPVRYDCGTNRYLVDEFIYIGRQPIVTFALSCHASEISRLLCSEHPLFLHPTPVPMMMLMTEVV